MSIQNCWQSQCPLAFGLSQRLQKTRERNWRRWWFLKSGMKERGNSLFLRRTPIGRIFKYSQHRLLTSTFRTNQVDLLPVIIPIVPVRSYRLKRSHHFPNFKRELKYIEYWIFQQSPQSSKKNQAPNTKQETNAPSRNMSSTLTIIVCHDGSKHEVSHILLISHEWFDKLNDLPVVSFVLPTYYWHSTTITATTTTMSRSKIFHCPPQHSQI